MYRPVDPKVSFPKMEEKVLAFWQENRIFEKSISQRDGGGEFVFYDGPPFATGLPHFGHFVPSTIKDIIPRYQTMKGNKVERRFGWDCHGLPVEYEMEKELGISGKRQIEEFGVAKFNEACRSIVLRYTREWRKVITRLGRWVDFDHDYKTMDPDYMESIWWVVSELWKKGLLYEGHYILPYCPRCSTSLSNFELNLGGYQDVADPAITVKFPLVDEPDNLHPRVDHHAVDAAVQPRPRAGRRHPLREGEGRGGASTSSPRSGSAPTTRSRSDVRDRRAVHGQGAGGPRLRAPVPLLRRRWRRRVPSAPGPGTSSPPRTARASCTSPRASARTTTTCSRARGIPVGLPRGRGGALHRGGPRLGRACS